MGLWYSSGHGHELVTNGSRVQVLVPLKTHRGEGMVQIPSEEAKTSLNLFKLEVLKLDLCESSERGVPTWVASSSFD
ncbi:hypothetical protein TNCV_3171041 [Trichonephila clavipes]|nr:hypothetical protein TNCV_3171041 [Trichonephila clavipes]